MGSHSLKTLHTRGDASEAPRLELQWKRAVGQKPSHSSAPCNFRRAHRVLGVAQSRPTNDSHKWPGTGGSGGQRHGGASSCAAAATTRATFPRGGAEVCVSPGSAPATQDTHLHRASKSTAWACAEPAAARSSSSRSGGKSATRGPEGTGPGRTARIACGVGLTAAGRLEPRLGHGRAATAESKLQRELEGERGERAGARGECDEEALRGRPRSVT